MDSIYKFCDIFEPKLPKKKIYYNNFMQKNKKKIKKKMRCGICGGSYTYFNKSHHLNSIKHNEAIKNNI